MISIGSLALASFVSIAWYFGTISLYEVVSDFANQWYWFVLATLYTATINEIFGHMICAHRRIKIDTNRITYKVMSFLLNVDHAWAPLTGLCKYHVNHHLYADQGNKDHLNWRLYWYNLCSASPLTFLYVKPAEFPNAKQVIKQQSSLHHDIINDSWTQWVEDNRIMLTMVFWLVLYVVLPDVLFKIVFMGRLLFSIYTAMAAIAGHAKIPLGYRNFDTTDTSHNNLLFHYMALGLMPGMLQNNHHGGKKNTSRWFEIDTAGLVERLLRPLLQK